MITVQDLDAAFQDFDRAMTAFMDQARAHLALLGQSEMALALQNNASMAGAVFVVEAGWMLERIAKDGGGVQ